MIASNSHNSHPLSSRLAKLLAVVIAFIVLLALAASAQASSLTSQVGGQITGATSSNYSLFTGNVAFGVTYAGGSGSIAVSTINSSSGSVASVSGEPTAISSNVESAALSPNGTLLAVTFQATSTRNGSVSGDPAYSGGQQAAIIYKVNATTGALSVSASGNACSSTSSSQYASVNVTNSALEVSNGGQIGVACDNTDNQFGDNPTLYQQYVQIFNTSGTGLASGGSTNLNPSSSQGSTPIVNSLTVASDATVMAGLVNVYHDPTGNGNVTESSGVQTFALTSSSVVAGQVLSAPGLAGQLTGSEYATSSPVSFGPSDEIAVEAAPVPNSSSSQPGVALFTASSGKYSLVSTTADPQLASVITSISFSADASTLVAESVPTSGGNPSAVAWATSNKAATLTPISCTGSVAQSDWIFNGANESFLAQDATSNTLTLQNYLPACSSGTGTSYTVPSSSSPPAVYASAGGAQAGSGVAPVVEPVSLPILTASAPSRNTKVVVVDLTGSNSKTTTWTAADKPLFAFDSDHLSAKARVELAPLRKDLARLAKGETVKRVVITGSTADGKNKYARFSRHLGFDRANTVEHFLFGSHKPKHVVVIVRSAPRSLVFPKHLTKTTHNELAAQLAMQRRVEIQVTVAR